MRNQTRLRPRHRATILIDVPNSLPRLIFLALVAATSSQAAEIAGTVREVSGDTATVTVQGDLIPAPGDKVEIFFKFGGSGDEIAVASGSVTGEEAGAVKVKITQAPGEVLKDQLARFTSSNPKPKSASLPSAPSIASTPAAGSTPTSPEAARYFAEGVTKFDAQDFKGALAAFTKAIELDPTKASFYANRASMYNLLKQSKRALADADQAIRINPQLALVYVIRGDCYVGSHQYKRALEDYAEAIRLDPKTKDAYNSRGFAYWSLGQHKLAVEDLTQAIELDPAFVDALTNRAKLYQAMGKTQLAKQDLARLKELKTKPR